MSGEHAEFNFQHRSAPLIGALWTRYRRLAPPMITASNEALERMEVGARFWQYPPPGAAATAHFVSPHRMTRSIVVLALLTWLALPGAVLAKRIPAPVVEPIVHEGVRYTVPNDKGTKGYVVASDATTGKKLWKKTVFTKCICPFVEHDVQWVFLKQMSLDAGRLILVDERGRIYSLDLKTHRVGKLKKQGAPHKGRTRRFG